MRGLQKWGWVLGLLAISGCAKFPDNPGTQGVRRFVIEIRLSGRVKPNYVYFVLFNFANDATGQAGPIPVVAPPWGNGFAAGAFTHFMRFDSFQPQGGYGLYRVTPGTSLTVFQYIGAPVVFQPVDANSTTLRFEFDLTQFIPNADEARAQQAVQINFIATDRIPIDPTDPTPKFWDALGDGRLPSEINRFLNIQRIDQNRIYRNADTNLEPEGDTRDPDLDIIDWRVEVRTL